MPDCFCSVDGTLVPGGLLPADVPQMVVITFDDAVNDENWDLYQRKLFPASRKNPNGCPIHATFYLSHEYTNYAMVQKLYNQGHEIAVHSITHRTPESWWDHNATIEDWFDEMVGQANIINRFGGVKMEDIRGVRVPFLKPGWNRQFLMMKEFGFVYDASIPAPLVDPPIWQVTNVPLETFHNQCCYILTGRTRWTTRSPTSASATGGARPGRFPASGRCPSTSSSSRSTAAPWSTAALPTSANK